MIRNVSHTVNIVYVQIDDKYPGMNNILQVIIKNSII